MKRYNTTDKQEEPFFDKKGREIKEYDLLKLFNFLGRRDKAYYIYAWVRIKNIGSVNRYVAMHLDGKNQYFLLSIIADKNRIVDAEIINR